MFYTAMKGRMAPLHPLNKFLSIKFIVFLTFWCVPQHPTFT